MRKLTECAAPRQASDLVDTLLAAGIDSQVRGDAAREVWVIDHDQMTRAGELLKEFEVHGRPAAADRAHDIRSEEKRVQAARNQNFVQVRTTWGTAEVPGMGAVTLFLIVASVLVGIYSDMGDPMTMTVQNLSIEPWDSRVLFGRVQQGELWRLVTPMFIHFGVVHLLFNMSGVHRFGRMIEHHHGPLVIIALVLWTQIPGAIGQYLLVGPTFGGMSGVLYGLFGFAWMQARFNRRHAYVIDEFTTWLMMVWFVLCVSGAAGPIANVGHAGGLIAGLIAGLPAYVGYLRARSVNQQQFTEHSWASVHVRGKTRLYRQLVAPYVPLWFLLIAGVAIAVEGW